MFDRDRLPEGRVLYHVNGELVPADDATVSVRDRGFMYGDAAFETLRAYGGSIFEWEAHADRLRDTCELLGIDHGLADADLRGRIDETLAANDLDDAYVKLSISRGVQPGKLTPGPATDPTVVVYVADLPRSGVGSQPVWDGPATVRTVERRRVPDEAIPARAKTHNYLDGILARLDAPDADEQLVCDAEGFVAEGATSNVFFVREGTLHTPSLDGPILPGVTRRVVLELAASAGVPFEEGSYRPGEIRDADEAFLTNTTWEVRPVERLDDVAFEDGPVTGRLADAFDELVETRHY
jgi:branched-chain amino acid aminotransferase